MKSLGRLVSTEILYYIYHFLGVKQSLGIIANLGSFPKVADRAALNSYLAFHRGLHICQFGKFSVTTSRCG